MPKKGKGGSPNEENGKNDDKKQQKIGEKLKMLIAYVLSILKWNKDKKEGKPAIKISRETASAKYADKNVYRIAVRDDASKSMEEVKDDLLSLMTTEEPPKAMEKAASLGHNPIYGLAMVILYKLQRLKRYKLMEIVEEGVNCILVVLPKQIHLNFTVADLEKQMRMAIKTSDPAKKIQANVEVNLTMQLLALTGELKVGMATDAPSIIVVYAANGAEKTPFHQIKLVASMTIVNNTEMKWKSGKREIRAFKGKKEIFASSLNKMLSKANFKLKGKKFQIAYNKKTNSYNWNKAAEGLEQAKAAKAIPANITFKRVWIQDGNAPVQDIGFGTVAGILSSMTNGTVKGKTNHIVVENLRKSFVNISLKRLLAAHPDEIGLLNEENQNLNQKLRLLLGLSTYKMPAIFTTEKEDWSFKNKDDLGALLQSGIIRAWKDNDVNALLSASKVEPVAHAELNRWWAHTGLTHSVEESEFTVTDEEHTMLDIVVAQTKEEAAPQTQ